MTHPPSAARHEPWRVDSFWNRSLLVIVFALVTHGNASAHDGHAASLANRNAAVVSPRFVAESELFELVGVLKGSTLTLWLDRWSDNTPVTDARIELEIAGEKFTAKPADQGQTYGLMLTKSLVAGQHAVVATIQAGKDTDLLSGELDIHETVGSATAPGERHLGDRSLWIWLVAGIGTALTALLVATVAWRGSVRRRKVSKRIPGRSAMPNSSSKAES